jgi:thioredoxin reductase (NADPH)
MSSDKMVIRKVVIIGGGCAGLTAGLYCARAELKPLIFSGDLKDKGGLLSKTSIVENYPGFPDGIMGYDLMENMEQQSIKQGATIIDSQITEINTTMRPFRLRDEHGNIYLTETIIIATGSQPNKLGLPHEDRLWSKGISSCAVCDGALYKNRKIVVIGGGDSALEEALFLTKFSEVMLIHRRDQLRASAIMQKRVLEHPKIKILYNTIVKELHGENKLEEVIVENVISHQTERITVDGLFYGLGLKPNTKLFKGLIDMDSDGYITRNHSQYETMTSVSGIFVAGDAHDRIYRQAVIACGDGCKAALDVNNYLHNEKK